MYQGIINLFDLEKIPGKISNVRGNKDPQGSVIETNH